VKWRHIAEDSKSTEMPLIRNLHQFECLPFPRLRVEASTVAVIKPNMFKFWGREDVKQSP